MPKAFERRNTPCGEIEMPWTRVVRALALAAQHAGIIAADTDFRNR